MKYPDNPTDFYDMIPKTIPENIKFRMTLHDLLAKDRGFQDVFKSMSLANPKILFNSVWFTYNPQKPSGSRNVPFILRPSQEIAIDKIDSNYKQSQTEDIFTTLAIDKSRKEGATEILMKYVAGLWWLEDEFYALIGSRKAEYVDKGVEFTRTALSGSHKCLMHKVCYSIAHMPTWAKPRFNKTYLHFENLDNTSVIAGESTNENFGAGDRACIIIVDEHGRMEYPIAQAVVENVSDTCNCNIFNSTHFYGAAHPYNKLLVSGKVDIIVLGWENNPEKNQGLYRSLELDEIEIKDVDYYRHKCREAFKDIKPMKAFKLSSFEKQIISEKPHLIEKLADIKFVADGGASNDGGWRSPWYDAECKRRSSRRDIAQNLDRNPVGAGDMFFTPTTLRRIRTDFLRKPSYVGELTFRKDIDEKIDRSTIEFKHGRAIGKLKWFVPLVNGRPDQSHNYVLGTDISRGTGASNSVHVILDVNTSEIVGIWADSNTPPESLADAAVALAYWVGGSSGLPLLIWEANGPGGSYAKRIQFHQYVKVYIPRDERARYQPEQNKTGWDSGDKAKYDMLLDLDIALGQGIKTTSPHLSVRVYDEDLLKELESYINYATGAVGPSELVSDSSGAKKAHGDRVISAGLVVLAAKLQPKAILAEVEDHPKNSIGSRLHQRKNELRKEKENRRW